MHSGKTILTSHSPRRAGLLLIASAALTGPFTAAADGPYVSLSASGTWQDNVTNAPSGDGTRSAFDAESGVTVSWLRSLDFSTILSAGVASDVDISATYRGLDSLGVVPSLELRHKAGIGPLATVLHAGLEGQLVGFTDPERSNMGAAILLGLSQRLDEALQFAVDGRLGSYDARDIVFTGSYASLRAALNWDVDSIWRIKLLGGWRNGDSVSDYAAVRTATGWGPVDKGAYNLPGAWHYVRTFNDPFVAYRVSAVTWSDGISVSPAIGPNSAVTLQFMRYDTRGRDRYVNNAVTASVSHRF